MKVLLVLLSLSINLWAFSQDFLLKLENPKDFKVLASTPLSNKYCNVSALKVIYEIKTNTIYFAHSKKYPFHYDFCSSVLAHQQFISDFNEQNYSHSEQRSFYLATINHYRDSNLYSFEFASSDQISSKHIEFYQMVKNLVFFNDELKLFPLTKAQQNLVSKDFPNINFIRADAIYKNQIVQILSPSISYGRLKFIEIDTLEPKHIHLDDIVVINGTPNDLPVCQGIISTEFQTPLSHIVILSHNRKTPMLALKKAWEDKHLSSLKNKLVKFEVGSNFYKINLAEQKEHELFLKKQTKKSVIKLALDTQTRAIQDINKLSLKDVDMVGGKAANFAELYSLSLGHKESLFLPKAAFAIPFFYYQQHISSNGIQGEINKLFEENVYDHSEKLENQLKKIQKAIKKSTLDHNFLEEVKKKIRIHGEERLRFRSSTNAEDIKDFNGAGLYRSKTGVLNQTEDNIEKAIKHVWASLWNVRAFKERKYFNIDQQSLAMGILVHEAFTDEAANGVVITKNIYRPENNGIIINIQKGENSVVKPQSGIDSEVTLLKKDLDPNTKDLMEIEYISYSSFSENKSILSRESFENIYQVVDCIKRHYYKIQNPFKKPLYYNFALDIEFKIEKSTNKFIVKQVRLY